MMIRIGVSVDICGNLLSDLQSYAMKSGHASSFGERTKEYLDYLPDSSELKAKTWEGSFARMIAVRAQKEMPSSELIQNKK
jgi:hypothetical protein